jgi:hypothetical protein
MLAAGCGTITRKTASGVTSLVTGTVKVAGKATGKVAVATIKAGAVTFVDAATGVVSSIPFVDGMSLNVALAAAKQDPRLKMFEIIRPSQVLKIGWQQLAKLGGSRLRSGDVIRMIQLATR